jgi:hypothetical protein
MRRSQNMNFYVNRGIAKAFRDATAAFDNRVGLCASAAFLMFLESDPKMQGEYLNRVFQLDLSDQVEQALMAVKAEQVRRIQERERSDTKSHRSARKT